MFAVPNKNLIPINTQEASALAHKMATDMVTLRQQWESDPEVRKGAQEEFDLPVEHLKVSEIARLVGPKFLEYDMEVVPTLGLAPPQQTRAFYQRMARARWKKPLHVEVWASWGRGKGGGTRGKFGSYSRRTSTVKIVVPGRFYVDDLLVPRLESQFYDTLVHEMTHAMDPDLNRRGLEYGKRPHEIRATARQVAEEMSKLVQVAEGSSTDRFWNALNESKQWRKAEKRHDDMGQRLILEYVYSDLSKKGFL